MIHDTVEMEKRGIPSVAIVASEFRQLAHITAVSLHYPNLRMVIVRHPFQTLKPLEVVKISDEKLEEIVAALTEPTPSAVRTADATK